LTLWTRRDYALFMTIAAQLTIIAIFIGLAVFRATGLPKRIILVINALAAGSILYLIITTVSTVGGRAAELLQSATRGGGFIGNAWIFTALAVVGIFAVPLILIFVVAERRRSVIIAIAFGLFNLGLTLTYAGDVSSGLMTATVTFVILLAVLFALEGLSIGALLMRSEPEWLFVAGLGLTAGLPALLGMNLTSVRSLDLIVPFVYAAGAGFMLFYLPFILGAGKTSNDIKWHFIGMLSGILLTGSLLTALPLVAG